jgi:hypothetical protein
MIGQSAGKNYAYLLGVYMGDGSIFSTPDGTRKFGMTSIDLDFCNAVKAAMLALGGTAGINGPYRDARFSKSRPYYMLYGFKTDILNMIEADTDRKQKLPDTTNATDEEKKALIQGVLDSEGYISEGTRKEAPQSNKRYFMGVKFTGDWFFPFVKLMESVGLQMGAIGEEKIKSGKIARRVYIKLTSYRDAGMRFNIARKQSKFDRWAECVGSPQRLHAEAA